MVELSGRRARAFLPAMFNPTLVVVVKVERVVTWFLQLACMPILIKSKVMDGYVGPGFA